MLYVILARQHYFLFLYRFYLLYILFLHFLQQLLIVFHLIIGLPTTVLFGIIIILLHRSSPFLSIILSFAFSLLFLFKLVVPLYHLSLPNIYFHLSGYYLSFLNDVFVTQCQFLVFLKFCLVILDLVM